MGGNFFDKVGGTIKVTLRGRNGERVMNMASTRGVFIWDIKKKGDDLDMKVRASGFPALSHIAEEHGFELEVQDKRGLPFVRSIIRRRMVFIGGGLLFIAAMYLLSSFVWTVEVSGNKTVAREKIIEAAARHGVYPGAPKWAFSRSGVEKELLKDVEDISYVQLDLKGVKARIKVVEKIAPLKDIDGPSNIVAKKDGLVETILVLDGQPRVKRGDMVAKGDILISGLVIPQPSPYVDPEEQGELEPSMVKARGEVRAKVWYQGYGECSLKNERERPGRGRQNKFYLLTPAGSLSLNIRHSTAFPYYDESARCRFIVTPWGRFGFKRVVLSERLKEVKIYSEEEAWAKAKAMAWRELNSKLGSDSRLVNTKIKMVSSPSEPLIRVRVIGECSENIAVAQPINTGAP